MKKLISILLPLGLLIMMVSLFIFKDSLTEAASKAVKSQASTEVVSGVSAYIDSAYNYTKNNEPYQYTFLEFGATGCSACKRMEAVMDDIRQEYPLKVKVVFVNVLLPENHAQMLYYGVAAIPTQVLLDKKGEEYYRHTGFISTTNLANQFKN
jgi:thioredoxin 1